jgi:hypothetical protein
VAAYLLLSAAAIEVLPLQQAHPLLRYTHLAAAAAASVLPAC